MKFIFLNTPYISVYKTSTEYLKGLKERKSTNKKPILNLVHRYFMNTLMDKNCPNVIPTSPTRKNKRGEIIKELVIGSYAFIPFIRLLDELDSSTVNSLESFCKELAELQNGILDFRIFIDPATGYEYIGVNSEKAYSSKSKDLIDEKDDSDTESKDDVDDDTVVEDDN